MNRLILRKAQATNELLDFWAVSNETTVSAVSWSYFLHWIRHWFFEISFHIISLLILFGIGFASRFFPNVNWWGFLVPTMVIWFLTFATLYRIPFPRIHEDFLSDLEDLRETLDIPSDRKIDAPTVLEETERRLRIAVFNIQVAEAIMRDHARPPSEVSSAGCDWSDAKDEIDELLEVGSDFVPLLGRSEYFDSSNRAIA